MIRINPATGLIEGVRFIPSPNHDTRPGGSRVEVLVVHAISLPPGQFGGPGVEQLFCNRLNPQEHPFYREIENLKVSAHLLIRRNGEVLQFVPFQFRAWHAGESYCEGRTRVNDFSIGIELEGTEIEPFEEIQYSRLADVTQAIMSVYPDITPQRIYGHSDIAPGRKQDPGAGFDWDRYLELLA